VAAALPRSLAGVPLGATSARSGSAAAPARAARAAAHVVRAFQIGSDNEITRRSQTKEKVRAGGRERMWGLIEGARYSR
jgi:hypothetical protein